MYIYIYIYICVYIGLVEPPVVTKTGVQQDLGSATTRGAYDICPHMRRICHPHMTYAPHMCHICHPHMTYAPHMCYISPPL